ncbi:hypothetical protein QE390_001152 [Siphonobacter sp. SORGH_AS 1065]|nr:hypothetical protein [Siphonobacter sp. SORGH_AS_1065]
MTMKRILSVLGFLSVFFLASCNKEEQSVAPTIDNEALTTVTLQLTNKANPTEVVTATVDGLNGTVDFSKDTLRLKANASYSGVILLLDKTSSPVADVSAEIKERQNIHLFVYAPASGLNMAVTITDKDTNPVPGPYPVGLTYDVRTGAASTGKLHVVLRHQPNTKDGTATPGSSDLDTNFDVVIQ